MFGSSFGDLAFRRVRSHRTHRSRMSSTYLRSISSSSFINCALVYLPSLSFLDAYRGRPGRVLERVFRVCGRRPCTAALRTFRNVLPAISTAFRRSLLLGSERRRLLASSFCCHASFLIASMPGPAHQPCAPRGRLEGGASSAAVESMTSAMSFAMSLMQVPSGTGGSTVTISFTTWHRRVGSLIWSAVLGVSLVLSLLLRFATDLRGMRSFT